LTWDVFMDTYKEHYEILSDYLNESAVRDSYEGCETLPNFSIEACRSLHQKMIDARKRS
jgi:hypothetical protein